jgi:TIR domain
MRISKIRRSHCISSLFIEHELSLGLSPVIFEYFQLPEPTMSTVGSHFTPPVSFGGAEPGLISGSGTWIAPRSPLMSQLMLQRSSEQQAKKATESPLLARLLDSESVVLRREDDSIVLCTPQDVKNPTAKTRYLDGRDIGHIAISYAREDKRLVTLLVEKLDQHFRDTGLHVWLDDYIAPGTVWAAEIEQRFKHAALVVVVMTESSGESKWVYEEIEFAKRNQVEILPISVDNHMFAQLAYLQYARMAPSMSDADWIRLLQAAEEILRKTRHELPPPMEA